MKVVLFCGGLGMRMREAGENVPKPMVTIGYRPILWHLMRYYAHYGHKDFILCLGYRGDLIKDYFLNYRETVSNDFVLSEGGKKLELMGTDIQDWRITFAETGIDSSIGMRLKAIERYVADQPEFLANYSDGLTDLQLPVQFEHFRARRSVASFLSVRPNLSYHLVNTEADGHVQSIRELRSCPIRINGGFFIMTRDIFRYIDEGDELVEAPFRRLIQEQRLTAYEYDGFWMSMDTFKDRQRLEDIYARGSAPWQVWSPSPVKGNRERAFRVVNA